MMEEVRAQPGVDGDVGCSWLVIPWTLVDGS
jgi:hypothetical protein